MPVLLLLNRIRRALLLTLTIRFTQSVMLRENPPFNHTQLNVCTLKITRYVYKSPTYSGKQENKMQSAVLHREIVSKLCKLLLMSNQSRTDKAKVLRRTRYKYVSKSYGQ